MASLFSFLCHIDVFSLTQFKRLPVAELISWSAHVCFSVRPSVSPSVRPCVRPSVGESVRPSVRPFVRPFVRPCVRPCVRASVRPCVRASVRASVRPSVLQEFNIHKVLFDKSGIPWLTEASNSEYMSLTRCIIYIIVSHWEIAVSFIFLSSKALLPPERKYYIPCTDRCETLQHKTSNELYIRYIMLTSFLLSFSVCLLQCLPSALQLIVDFCLFTGLVSF